MGSDDNIQTIERIYEAFGRGDVSAVLANVADDVDWATQTSSTIAPWYGVRHGKDGVASFFQVFGSTMDVQEFNPRFSPPTTPRYTRSCTAGLRVTQRARASTTTCTTTFGSRAGRSPLSGHRRHRANRGRAGALTRSSSS